MEKEKSLEQDSENAAQEEARIKLKDSLFFLDNYRLIREGSDSVFLETVKSFIHDPKGCLFHETGCSNLVEAASFLNAEKMTSKEPEISFSLTPWWWSKRAEQCDRNENFQMCVMLSRDKSLAIKKAFIDDNLQDRGSSGDKDAVNLFEEYLEVRTGQDVAPKDFSAIFLRLFKWDNFDPVGLRELSVKREQKSSKWHEYLVNNGRVNDADLGSYLKDASEIEALEERLVEDYYKKNPAELENELSIAAQIGMLARAPVFDYYGNLLFPSQMERNELEAYLASV